MIYVIPTDTCYWIACPISDTKSYERIYKIKKRDLSKALAIIVPDFKWLENNTNLNLEQIDFLKNYKKAFTVLADCDHLKLWINYIDEENNEFLNRDIYKKFAFRVAHNNTQKKLLKKHWPMFLTSANISNNPELYSPEEVEKEFWYYLSNKKIEFLWSQKLEKTSPSDIFEFEWESLDIKYLRKN